VKRGMSGYGQYHLKDKYQYLKADYYAQQCLNPGSLEDIIKQVKEQNFDGGELLQSVENALDDNKSSSELDIKEIPTIDNNPHTKVLTEKRRDTLSSLTPDISCYLLTRAYQIIEHQNISYNVKFGIFTIKQPKEVAKVVTLFPKVNCTCKPTGECHHILAVKISLGMNIGKKLNSSKLAQLRNNGKQIKEKRAGRKRPRALDVSGMEAGSLV